MSTRLGLLPIQKSGDRGETEFIGNFLVFESLRLCLIKVLPANLVAVVADIHPREFFEKSREREASASGELCQIV